MIMANSMMYKDGLRSLCLKSVMYLLHILYNDDKYKMLSWSCLLQKITVVDYTLHTPPCQHTLNYTNICMQNMSELDKSLHYQGKIPLMITYYIIINIS